MTFESLRNNLTFKLEHSYAEVEYINFVSQAIIPPLRFCKKSYTITTINNILPSLQREPHSLLQEASSLLCFFLCLPDDV